MNILDRARAVAAAERRVTEASRAWRDARHACTARVAARPFACLGIVAGIGVALGGLRVRPWRLRGLRALLGPGALGGIATALRLLDEFGPDGADLFGRHGAPPAANDADADADDPARPAGTRPQGQSSP